MQPLAVTFTRTNKTCRTVLQLVDCSICVSAYLTSPPHIGLGERISTHRYTIPVPVHDRASRVRESRMPPGTTSELDGSKSPCGSPSQAVLHAKFSRNRFPLHSFLCSAYSVTSRCPTCGASSTFSVRATVSCFKAAVL